MRISIPTRFRLIKGKIKLIDGFYLLLLSSYIMFKTILQGLGKLVFPPICILCKTKKLDDFPRQILCVPCEGRLQENIPPFCPQCSRHLHFKNYLTRCPSCTHHQFHFDFAWSPLIYNDHLRNLIHAFKYHQKTYLKYYFVERMISFIRLYHLDIHQFDLIIPTPLYSTRLRERGYNQSELLAHLLSREYSIPLHLKNLIKIRHTPKQAMIKRKDRFTNLKGAFRINHSEKISGKKILIMDDLITTGITASEMALTLKSSGAKKVAVLTAAIA